jgi:hypothetical protein
VCAAGILEKSATSNFSIKWRRTQRDIRKLGPNTSDPPLLHADWVLLLWNWSVLPVFWRNIVPPFSGTLRPGRRTTCVLPKYHNTAQLHAVKVPPPPKKSTDTKYRSFSVSGDDYYVTQFRQDTSLVISDRNLITSTGIVCIRSLMQLI